MSHYLFVLNRPTLIIGCLAEWSAPEDDGGTPITQYIIEKAEGASVNWTVCGQTKGDVTKCRVTGLKTGKDHRLQVLLKPNYFEKQSLPSSFYLPKVNIHRGRP